MYKLMQKYNRKLLAIVMVFLMIAFVIPQFSKQPTPGTTPAGTMGDETISMADVQRSHYDWQIIKGGDPSSRIPGVLFPMSDPRTGEMGYQPLVALLAQTSSDADLRRIIEEIERHPAMYVLLQKEAEKNGVTVSEATLDGMLADVFVQLPGSAKPMEFDMLPQDSEIRDQIRQAVRSFLLVTGSYNQAMSMIKVSQPLLQNRMAKALQEIKLNLVEFDNKNYVDKVAPPTPDQIKAQFDKYADVLPGQTDPKTNPFGFGYKYPDRVKIQDIGISNAEVKKAIRSAKTEYDWDVEAQKYYKKHPGEFASTQPATTRASDALSLGGPSKPSTQPTTRPFNEVRDTIVDDLIRPEAERLQSQIQSRLTSQMRDDWNGYHAAVSKSTTAPSSSVGVSFDSVDYFSKLSDQVQKQFKVVPTVQTFADKFRDVKELSDLPGIGKANAMFGQQFLPFNIYATALVAKFGKNPLSEQVTPLQLFEPSRPLSDFSDDATWFFRLIDADPAHKPADSREVLQKIEEDLRQQAAYNMAHADAEKLLEAARTGNFASAAIAAGKTPIATPYISARGTLPPEVPVTTTSQPEFIEQAFDMLSDAATNKQALKLIGLPRDSKVFVAELADVRRIPLFAGQSIEPQLARQIASELGRDMYQQWYQFDSLVQRTHFVDASKKKDTEG